MITFIDKVDLRNHTLILPTVAVGNVSQLVVDLLISSIPIERIGYISNSSLIPVVGTDPYDIKSKEICTSVDLYHNFEKRIVFLQIRSPVIKKLSKFLNGLRNFVNDQQITKVSYI